MTSVYNVFLVIVTFLVLTSQGLAIQSFSRDVNNTMSFLVVLPPQHADTANRSITSWERQLQNYCLGAHNITSECMNKSLNILPKYRIELFEVDSHWCNSLYDDTALEAIVNLTYY